MTTSTDGFVWIFRGLDNVNPLRLRLCDEHLPRIQNGGQSWFFCAGFAFGPTYSPPIFRRLW